MPNPWDNDPIISGPQAGPPPTMAQPQSMTVGVPHKKEPPPQTPAQAQQDTLQNENTQQKLELDRAAAIDKVRDGYRQDKRVLTFEAAIPIAVSSLSSPENGAGDNMLVNAAAKVGDPSTGVQQREGASWEGSQPELDQAKASMLKQFGTDGYGNFTPEGRTKIREAIRQRTKFLAQQYELARADHGEYIKSLHLPGVNADAILGPNAYKPFEGAEAQYIRDHGGTPKVDGVPVDQAGARATAHKAGEFGGEQDPRLTELSPEQKTAYDAWWKANPDPTPEQLQQFGSTINLNISNAKEIVAGEKAGRGLSSDIQVLPNISDMRGQGGVGETADAAVRGAADVASSGLADKAAALGDTVTRGGTFSQNLGRQYAISDYDSQHHPWARGGGQLAGALAVPMGEISSLPQLAIKGGAVGGAYGIGSSRSLSDVPQNALLGTAAGAVMGPVAKEFLGAGKLGSALAEHNALSRGPKPAAPPLVDPVTGELNQPMDALRPAARVQAMKDYGMQTITPGMAGGRSARVLEQGFNNLPASAGIMEDINSKAAGELRRSMQGVAQQFGTSKTMNEGGSELQRGAQSWIGRANAVDHKVYEAIPINPRVPAMTENTAATLKNLTGKVSSNKDLAQMVNDPALGKYLKAIQKGGLDWQGMKDFRSFIGAQSGQFRFARDARGDGYASLYSALSEDMRATAAAQGPKALSAFVRANSFHAAMESRIEGALVRILGKDANGAPEKAAAAVQAMTKGGKAGGDLRTLAQVKASTVKTGAWDEVASTLIHLGGQPANSEGRAFQPATFVNWYADMSEPARAMLFKPELRKSLDGFVSMTQQLGRLKGLNNTSNSAPTMFGGGTILAGAAALLNPLLGLKLAAGLAANYGAAKMWTSPRFVNIVTGYGRALAAGNANAAKGQVSRLSKLAATDPELRMPIENLLKALANDNAPKAGQIAASPDEGPQGQTQPK
ncbi:MAG: hypothetical protein JWR80_9498 [Bradyrhizobium sp.]|nr:hypothetical protein [Bradyrhizobium sp.]